jgi:hypothetical protein
MVICRHNFDRLKRSQHMESRDENISRERSPYFIAEAGVNHNGTLIRRRLLILLSGSYEVKEDKRTAPAVHDTNDSTGCVWVGISRSEPVAAGTLA